MQAWIVVSREINRELGGLISAIPEYVSKNHEKKTLICKKLNQLKTIAEVSGLTSVAVYLGSLEKFCAAFESQSISLAEAQSVIPEAFKELYAFIGNVGKPTNIPPVGVNAAFKKMISILGIEFDDEEMYIPILSIVDGDIKWLPPKGVEDEDFSSAMDRYSPEFNRAVLMVSNGDEEGLRLVRQSLVSIESKNTAPSLARFFSISIAFTDVAECGNADDAKVLDAIGRALSHIRDGDRRENIYLMSRILHQVMKKKQSSRRTIVIKDRYRLDNYSSGSNSSDQSTREKFLKIVSNLKESWGLADAAGTVAGLEKISNEIAKKSYNLGDENFTTLAIALSEAVSNKGNDDVDEHFMTAGAAAIELMENIVKEADKVSLVQIQKTIEALSLENHNSFSGVSPLARRDGVSKVAKELHDRLDEINISWARGGFNSEEKVATLAERICSVANILEAMSFPSLSNLARRCVLLLKDGSSGVFVEEMANLHLQVKAVVDNPYATTSSNAETDNPYLDTPISADALSLFLDELDHIEERIEKRLQECAEFPDDPEPYRELRRAFHTIKGSGKMVGLHRLGEAAWNVQRALDAWVDKGVANEKLLAFVKYVMPAFDRWFNDLKKTGKVEVNAVDIDSEALKLEKIGDEFEAQDADYDVHVSSEVFSLFEEKTPGPAERFVAEAPPQPVEPESVPEMEVVPSAVEAVNTARDEMAAFEQEMLNAQVEEIELSSPQTLEGEEGAHSIDWAQLFRRGSDGVGDSAEEEAFLIFRDEFDVIFPKLEAIVDEIADGSSEETLTKTKRYLHTLKGSARMVGAEGFGQFVHNVESAIEEVEPGSTTVDDASGFFAVCELLALWADTIQGGAVFTMPEKVTLVPYKRSSASAPVETTPSVASILYEETPSVIEAPAPVADVVLVAPVVAVAPAAPIVMEAPIPSDPVLAEAPLAVAAVLPPIAPVSVPVAQPARLAVAPYQAKALSKSTGAEKTARIHASALEGIEKSVAESLILQTRSKEEIVRAKDSFKELSSGIVSLKRILDEIFVQVETGIASSSNDSRHDYDALELDRFTRVQELSRYLNEKAVDLVKAGEIVMDSLCQIETSESIRAIRLEDIRYEISKAIMVPFSESMRRIKRTAEKAAADAGKRAAVRLVGDIDAPTWVIERIMPAIDHILRNCLAHGIESESIRLSRDKPGVGNITLTLSETNSGFNLVISDDGNGIDPAKLISKAIEKGLLKSGDKCENPYELLFAPGFSTSEKVSELSGRGVGLDVVKSLLQEIGGNVEVTSKIGAWSAFTLFVPSDVTTMPVVPVETSGFRFLIPSSLVSRIAILKDPEFSANMVCIDGAWFKYVESHKLLDLPKGSTGAALIMTAPEGEIALIVDRVEPYRRVLLRQISRLMLNIPGVLASTVDAGGLPYVILNPLRMLANSSKSANGKPKNKVMALIVDDSSTVRQLTRKFLEKNNFAVSEARDGQEGLVYLKTGRQADFIILDVDMPIMNGFEFARAAKGDEKLAHIPIIMITSRTAEKHRKEAESIGIEAYFGKPLDEGIVLETLKKLLAKGASELVATS